MKIFSVFYGGGHVESAAPVIRALRGRGHEVVALALTTAALSMRRQGLACATAGSYVDAADPVVRAWGERLAAEHHNPGVGVALEESVAYLGVSYRDLIRAHGEAGAAERFARRGRQAFFPIDFMRETLARERPDAVFATCSPRMESAALAAAHALGIPSVCIGGVFDRADAPRLASPEQGDWFAATNLESRDWVVGAGRAPETVRVTGNPGYDSLTDPKFVQAAAAWRAERGVAEQDRLVLWAEQPEPGNPRLPRTIRAALNEICLQRERCRLVVRLHPSTSIQGERVPREAIQSFPSEPLPTVLNACDAVVTFTSTVGAQALLLNKPVMVLNLSQFSVGKTLSNGQGAWEVDRLADAPGALFALLDQTPRALELAEKRRRLATIGSSAERVADLIETAAGTRVRT